MVYSLLLNYLHFPCVLLTALTFLRAPRMQSVKKLDPKLHKLAAVRKGLEQTMSDTMGLAVPLAERLSCQQYKKPHTRCRREVWPQGEFMESESFA